MFRFTLMAFLVLCALMLWLASPVFAAEVEGGGWGWWETLGRWFNLAVLFGAIAYAVRLPAREYFRKRRDEIQREMREAREAQEAAEKKLAEVEARLSNLDAELAELRREVEKESATERDRILELARLEADKIMSQASREIDGLGRTVRKDLKEYAARLAVKLAEERIRSRMTEGDEQRLVDRFFADLKSRAGGLR